MKSGDEVGSEVLLPASPGERRIALHAAPLQSEGGPLMGAVLVLHDITELRKLESVRSDFVANVSHELKTPLAAIRGMVETMLDDPAMDAEVRQRFLGKTKAQTDRLSALVSDLLVLSRVEASRTYEPQEDVDLVNVAEEVSALAQQAAETKDLALRVDSIEKSISVKGDSEALHQMITNLVSNAITYTPRQGRIDVRLRVEDDSAVVEVEDTGPGIERSHLDRIFERFYRVDKARSRELGGTGLGLSIVKHIALAHKGSVTVQSEVGQGTCFRVRLPLATAVDGRIEQQL